MLEGTAFPVAAVPSDASVLQDPGAEPLLFYTQVSEPSRMRNAVYMPTIAGRIASLRICIAEPVIWRILDLANSIGAATVGGGAGGAAGGGDSRTRSRAAAAPAPGAAGPASAGGGGAAAATASGAAGCPAGANKQQVARADQPLQVDMLSFDDLKLRVSFRTSRASRPRWAHRALVLTIGDDMLNFDDLELTIPGLEMQHIRWASKQIIDQVQRRLQVGR
jgi:hypothetical protein